MYIIQAKHDPEMDDFVDMDEAKTHKEAMRKMKKLTAKYLSAARIIEVKAKAYLTIESKFEKENTNVQKDKKIKEEVKETKEEPEGDGPDDEIKPYKPEGVCKEYLCKKYINNNCDVFKDKEDPLTNSDGECQAYKPVALQYIDDSDKKQAKNVKYLKDVSEKRKEVIEFIKKKLLN